MLIVDEVMHESKEVSKGWRPEEALEEVIKESDDEELEEWRSEAFETYEFSAEGLSFEEISLLEVAKDFSELIEGLSSLNEFKIQHSLWSTFLEAVIIRFSR